MKFNVLTIFVCIVGFAGALRAESVDSRMERLKLNADNSEANHKAYAENSEIAKANVATAEQALKDLEAQRAQLLKNVDNIDGNKAALQKMRDHVVDLQKRERESLREDDKRLAELQDLVRRLQAAKKAREVNVDTYDKKLAEMDQEKSGWDQQKSAVAELTQALEAKKTEAEQAKKTWESKGKTYAEQAARWRSEADKSSRQYRELSSLK
jgi:chromosome segregation ATPase